MKEIEREAIKKLHKFCSQVYEAGAEPSDGYMKVYLQAGVAALDERIKTISEQMGLVSPDDEAKYLELGDHFQVLIKVRTMLLKMLSALDELLEPPGCN